MEFGSFVEGLKWGRKYDLMMNDGHADSDKVTHDQSWMLISDLTTATHHPTTHRLLL